MMRPKYETPEITAAQSREAYASTECAVKACSRKSRCNAGGQRDCLMHYKRWKRHCDPGAEVRQWSPANADKRPCVADACDRLEDGSCGYCKMHMTRIRRHGDASVFIEPAARNTSRGALHPSWVGSEVGYGGAHIRVRSLRGSASAHQCECGSVAAHWAYTHDDPDERQSPTGPYSADVNRYVPMCVPCHKRFDLGRLS